MPTGSIDHRFYGIEGMMQQIKDDNNPITLEELVWQESFRNWVLHPTPVLNRHWQNWKEQHPQQKEVLVCARQVVQALKVKNRPISEEDIQYVIMITRQQLDLPAPTTKILPLASQQVWAAAASILLIITIGIGYYLTKPSGPTLSQTKLNEPANLVVSSKANQTLHLADGSTVQLAQGSELRYPKEFGSDKREVFLTGAAHFDVKRRPDQPFLVHANGSVTRVLGTRFTILAPSGSSKVTVNVQSGKVSVLPESEWVKAQHQTDYKPRTVIITPNQQVVFERTNERMDKSLVSSPTIVQPSKVAPSFNFVNTPVPIALKTLEQVYGIPIVFDPVTFQNCLVTAPLADEPLFEKLAIICETIGARYEILETQIVISGRGCTM